MGKAQRARQAARNEALDKLPRGYDKALRKELVKHAKKRRRAMIAEMLNEVVELQDSACPTCKEVGEHPCVTKSGKVTKRHANRPVTV